MKMLNKECRVCSNPLNSLNVVGKAIVKISMLCENISVRRSGLRLPGRGTGYPVLCSSDALKNCRGVMGMKIPCVFAVAVKWYCVGLAEDNIYSALFELCCTDGEAGLYRI